MLSWIPIIGCHQIGFIASQGYSPFFSYVRIFLSEILHQNLQIFGMSLVDIGQLLREFGHCVRLGISKILLVRLLDAVRDYFELKAARDFGRLLVVIVGDFGISNRLNLVNFPFSIVC